MDSNAPNNETISNATSRQGNVVVREEAKEEPGIAGPVDELENGDFEDFDKLSMSCTTLSLQNKY